MSSDWRPTTIEEIAAPHPAALATGPFGSSIGSKFFTDFGMPVIRGSNLSADVSARLFDEGLVFVSDEKAKQFQRSMAKRGDLVFTCWGTINQVGLIDSRSKFDRYIVSNKQMKLSVDLAKADPRFIYYLFSGPEKQAEILDNGIGSSVPGFNLGQLKRHEILLPSLVEQIQIANLLEMLDDRINLLRETNATLEAIAQALFKSWFVDFDPVRAKMEGRAPEGMDEATAALFPDGFVELGLGAVPNGWRWGTLVDIATFQNGYAFKSKDWTSGGHPVVKIGDVKPGVIDLAGCSFVSPETVNGLERFRLERGDLLVGMTGYVGETGLVPSVEPLPYLNQRVGRIAPEAGPAGMGSVYCAVRTSEFKEYAEAQSHGSAQANISGASLMSYPMVISSNEVTVAFNELIAVSLENILSNYEQAQTLATLRDTLLPRLISGQLRLPEAQAQIEERTP
jgi:type I restriction enzyme S subunit